MRRREKKVIAGLVAVAVVCGSLIYDSVGLAQSNESVEVECPEIIRSYYQAVNEKTFEDILELYSEELSDSVYSFWMDEKNKVEKNGIFGVETVEILDFWKDDVCYSTVRIDAYTDVESYVVKCWMEVDESDKYYQEGNNYFRFTLGEQDGQQKIIDVSALLAEELLELDKNTEDVAFYVNRRNYFIYGDAALEYEISPLSVEYYAPPIYHSMISVPVNISVEGEGILDFKEYCKNVTTCEVSVLDQKQALYANAIAIKMFGMYCSYFNMDGTGFDIKKGAQAYDANQSLSTACVQAVNDTWDVFMLDSYGRIFRTDYRSSNQVGWYANEYCRKNGGLLSQKESNNMAHIYGYEFILSYFYEKVEGVDYYNGNMEEGKLIFTKSHMHTYPSSGNKPVCYICGAVRKADS